MSLSSAPGTPSRTPYQGPDNGNLETDDKDEASMQSAESSLHEVYHGLQDQILYDSANENPTNVAEEILDKTHQNDLVEGSEDHLNDVKEILDEMKVQLLLLMREPPTQEHWASCQNFF